MFRIVELEELGQMIMSASVKAEFLDLPRVVASLDVAFDDVVRLAVAAKQRLGEAVAREEEELIGEVAVGG